MQQHDGALSVARRDVVEAQARFYVGHAMREGHWVLIMGHGRPP
jgi:hypothetical protein